MEARVAGWSFLVMCALLGACVPEPAPDARDGRDGGAVSAPDDDGGRGGEVCATCEHDEACLGPDRCDGAGLCVPGDPLEPGAPCETLTGGPGRCELDEVGALLCIDARCGDGVVDPGEACDDGNDVEGDGCTAECTPSDCVEDADCDDGDVCDGAERCVDGECAPGTDLTCTPSDACHAPSCDPASGCAETAIDADGDGHVVLVAGVCGTDCDDGSPAVHPGAEEICGNGVDDDCDGTPDENTLDWYPDCDGDGVASLTRAGDVRRACAAPEPSVAGCPSGLAGGWTMLRPDAAVGATQDCDDTRADRSPLLSETTGDGVDGDCDGGEVCYRDADDDGARSTLTTTSADADCSDVHEGRASDPVDCDDSRASVRPGLAETVGDGIDANCDGRETCYRDADDDGYRSSDTTLRTSSTDTDCNDAGEARASDPGGDRCDTDRRTNPGVTAFSSSRTTCGSYDWDSDGTQEREITRTGTCSYAGSLVCAHTTGWVGTIPACGDPGTFMSGCNYLGIGNCQAVTTTATQRCR